MGRYSPLMVAISMALAGVGASATTDRAAAQEITFFRIGTGSTAGTYYPVGTLIASAISNPPGSRPCESGGSCGVPGLIAAATASQGSVANVEAIAAGDLESGLAQSDIVSWANSGEQLFAGRDDGPKVAIVANLYPESVHLVVRKASGIEQVADLKGHRVSLDTPGSGTRINAQLILDGFGIAEGEIDKIEVPPDQAIQLLLDDQLDAFFRVAGYPATAVSELAEAGKIALLPLSGLPAMVLQAHNGFFAVDHIPAGTYPGVDEIDTLSVGAQFVVGWQADDDLVYAITRALWHPNNRSVLDSGHVKGRLIRQGAALNGVPAELLHPGAARYYREVGLLK